MTYQDLVNFVIANTDDMPTFPLTKVKPKWYHTYVEDVAHYDVCQAYWYGIIKAVLKANK